MNPALPDIPPQERTPLVLPLLDIIQQQQLLRMEMKKAVRRLPGNRYERC
jgi:hypothetical protein